MPRQTQEARERAAVGGAVRELRERHRISRDDLARSAGVSTRRIESLEAGRIDPGYVLLVRLAKALGVGADTLMRYAATLEREHEQ